MTEDRTCRRCPNARDCRGLCRKHYTHYRQQRDRAGITAYVDTTPSRAHIQDLRAARMSCKQIARLAGICDTTVTGIIRGRYPTVRTETHNAIMAVPVPGALYTAVTDGVRVDPTGTRRRLRGLVAIGYTQSYLADRLNMGEGNFGAIILGRKPLVLAGTARRVVQLYDELTAQPPFNPNLRAVRHAKRKRWFPTLAWDDETIDDPNATPQHDVQRRVLFPERFIEVRDHLGINDVDEIAKLMKLDPHSVRDQVRRHREVLAS